MINEIDIEEDDDEDLEYDELGDYEAEWEDEKRHQELLAKMPNGWYMIKVINFNAKKLNDIDEWMKENCHGKYERVGFRSNCAYSVGVQFENAKDAVLFRLMWG